MTLRTVSRIGSVAVLAVAFWVATSCSGSAGATLAADAGGGDGVAWADGLEPQDAGADGIPPDTVDSGAPARPVVPDFDACERRAIRSHIFYPSTSHFSDAGLSSDEDAGCSYNPGQRDNARLYRFVHTWPMKPEEREAFWDVVNDLDWDAMIWDHRVDFDVPHGTSETISLVCDNEELIIHHYFDYLDEGTPNLALHDLIQETLWPRDCEPWTHHVLQEAEVSDGWERSELPGVSATDVVGCGDGLAHFNEKEIWLSDDEALELSPLPSLPAGIARDAGDARGYVVEAVACAGWRVYGLVLDRYRGYTDRWFRLAVLDTADTMPAWVDVSDELGSGDLYGLAGSGDLAVVWGEDGAVVRDGTGDVLAYDTGAVLAAAVRRRPGLDTFWALQRRPATAYYAYDDGRGWRDGVGALPADAVEGVLRYVSFGSTSLILDTIGGLYIPSLGGNVEIVGGATEDHGWVGLSASEASFAVVADWRLPRDPETGALLEHAVALARVYPDPDQPAETILWSDRMTRPPGMFVSRDGTVFVPAGDKLLVLRERPTPER